MYKNMTSDLSSFCAADRWCNHGEAGGGDGSRVCVSVGREPRHGLLDQTDPIR